MSILYELGEYGPILLIIFSWFLLWNNKNLFFYYTVGIFANAVLNLILKGFIQEPRPMFDDKKVRLLKTHGKEYFYKNGIPFNIFGMPSAHSQATLFSTIFIYLTFKQTNLLYIYIPLTLITCYQRVKFDFHSISQIIVGGIVGLAFGYFVYNLAREKIKNRIREKPDDDGPV
jgi:membrane-associated phospholipid phosphatase